MKNKISFNLFDSLLMGIKYFSFLFAVIVIFFYVPLLGDEEFSLEDEVSLSSDVLEMLEKLKENPLDINTAKYEEIILIPYITPNVALRIINFREQGNTFSDTSDLLKVAGINKPLQKKILPYISIKKKLITISKFNWKTIASKQYPVENKYNGSPFKYSNKLKVVNGNITLGGTAYKNAYEENYFDFYTLYGYLQREGFDLIVGNYAIDTGERMVSGYPGFIFKSSGMIKGKQVFIKPYTSGFEDYSLKGCAVKKDWDMLDAGFFASYKKLDATIENDTVKKVLYGNSYHRTETEIGKKDKVSERLFGGMFSIHSEKFTIGSTSLIADYDKVIKPDSANYYRYSGGKYALADIHSSFTREYLSLWSEFTYSFYAKGSTFIIGTSVHPPKTTISLLYRDYSETFYSPRAFAFCESEVRNERGFYSYIAGSLPYGFRFSGFTDVFTRPNPTYFNPFSTNGYETSASVEKKIQKSFVYVRYKRKEKNTYRYENMSLKYYREGLRLSLKTKINRDFDFRVLWEGKHFRVPYITSQEWGNLISLSFSFAIFTNTKLQSGIAFYETESYNSRIYLFLNDIPGSMYTKAFYGTGKDIYLLLKSRVFNNLRIYGRFEINAKEEGNTEAIKLGMEWR